MWSSSCARWSAGGVGLILQSAGSTARTKTLRARVWDLAEWGWGSAGDTLYRERLVSWREQAGGKAGWVGTRQQVGPVFRGTREPPDHIGCG